MDYDAVLLANIKQLVSLSEADEAHILNQFHPLKLNKKEYLIAKDEVSNYMNFIVMGSLRSFYIDAQGKEHTLQLGIENWWINDLYSYLTQTPATQYIQSVEESVVMRIPRHSHDELLHTIPSFERFFRLKIQRGYIALQERTILRMSQTAEERYLQFRTKYRSLEQRFPQYMIASYLGVTPEFLSAVRKKLSTLN